MEIRSPELGMIVDLEVGSDVYIEHLKGSDAVLLNWEDIPNDVKEELDGIRLMIEKLTSRCSVVIHKNRNCTPLDDDGFPLMK